MLKVSDLIKSKLPFPEILMMIEKCGLDADLCCGTDEEFETFIDVADAYGASGLDYIASCCYADVGKVEGVAGHVSMEDPSYGGSTTTDPKAPGSSRDERPDPGKPSSESQSVLDLSSTDLAGLVEQVGKVVLAPSTVSVNERLASVQSAVNSLVLHSGTSCADRMAASRLLTEDGLADRVYRGLRDQPMSRPARALDADSLVVMIAGSLVEGEDPTLFRAAQTAGSLWLLQNGRWLGRKEDGLDAEEMINSIVELCLYVSEIGPCYSQSADSSEMALAELIGHCCTSWYKYDSGTDSYMSTRWSCNKLVLELVQMNGVEGNLSDVSMVVGKFIKVAMNHLVLTLNVSDYGYTWGDLMAGVGSVFSAGAAAAGYEA
jgi:hypothetical protein